MIKIPIITKKELISNLQKNEIISPLYRFLF